MINVRIAKTLKVGQILYHVNHRNADGTPQRWKVNGQVKFWKTRPTHFRVPVKHGLRYYDYIDHDCKYALCVEMIEVKCPVCHNMHWVDKIDVAQKELNKYVHCSPVCHQKGLK